MLFAKVKDFKLRQKYLKNEYKIKTYKYVFINLLFKHKILVKDHSYLNIVHYNNKLKKVLTKSNKTKIVRRCLHTNRTKNINRPLNLSRAILKNLISFGFVPGYKKAVW